MIRHRWRVVGLVTLVGLLGLIGRLIDYPKLAGGFKGDEATYVSMAFSVAEDFDLGYDRRDLDRFGRIYGNGRGGQPVKPEGIFLKPGTRPTAERLEFAKAFVYSVAAAPFARLGGLGGMFIFNLLLLAGCVWCAILFCAARVGGWRGHMLAVSFVGASSAPIWAVWLTPEIFNFALVFYAYFLWSYKKVRGDTLDPRSFLGSAWSDAAAAVLIGIATYSKLSNGPLIAPLVAHALWRARADRQGLLSALGRAVLISVVFAACTGGLFGLNKLITGTANYQAGALLADGTASSRKTFYGNFPFDDAASTYESAAHSNEMVTDSAKISSDILFPGDARFWPLLGHNVWYFFSGRDSGLVPYFFPGVLILALWLWRWRQTSDWQFFTFLAAAGTALILIVWTPYSWNGAGGPPGSRYFLSVYPLFLFLLPTGTGAVAGLTSWGVGLSFVGAMLMQPFASSKAPWTIPERAPLRWLPIELTMMDDVPARLNPRRGRLPFGSPRNALLYYMDAGTYTPEDSPDGQFFWVAGDVQSDIVVRLSDRTQAALMRLNLQSAVANHVTVEWGGSRCELTLAPNQPAACELRAGGAVWAHGGYFFRLRVTTTAGYIPSATDAQSADSRNLGVRLQPVFDDTVPK